MLAPQGCCLSRWLCTAEQVGRQVTTEKAKEKLPLTSIYPRVLVLGNLQLPAIQKFKWIMHLGRVQQEYLALGITYILFSIMKETILKHSCSPPNLTFRKSFLILI